MDTLLITAQKDLDTIGLKFLHYYLLGQGYDSSLLYLPTYEPGDDIKLKNIHRFIAANRPKLIGISLMSTEYNHVRHLTKYLKDSFQSLPIVWGGIHPTIAPEMCLEYADYACVGEGEKTLTELTDAVVNSRNRDISLIKNLCYKDNGRIKKNNLYPLLDNLDEVPFYDHIPKKAYIQHNKEILSLDRNLYKKYARYEGTVYSVMTSRGCPFSCTYCCNNLISRLYGSKKVRKRSIANVISELKLAAQDNPWIEYINFQDDCFCASSNEYMRAFCESYKKEIHKSFIIRSIPSYITQQKLGYLKSAGLGWISLGLQSGSDYVCKEIYQRKSLKAEFLAAAKLIKKYNVAAFYDVILDSPFETDDDRIDTISTLAEIPKPYYTEFFSLSLYIGTELYEKALKECPGYMENYMEKDYLSYKKTLLNDMTRIATFVGEKKINKLIRIYRENPSSFSFRLNVRVFKLLSAIFFEPLTYLQLIKLSQGGSYLKTLKVLRFYFKLGLRRYLKQFNGSQKE